MLDDDNIFLSLHTESKMESERLALLLSIGIGVALKEKLITPVDAETFLFTPYTLYKLRKIKARKEVTDIIHLGTELANVESLIPKYLERSIDDILSRSFKALKKMPRPSCQVWIGK